MSKKEQINDQLEQLKAAGGIKGCAIVRRDGLLIASQLPEDVNENQVGAMTASTVGSGETASDTLGLGSVKGVTIESKNGKVISMGVGDEGILTILTEEGVSMGDISGEIAEVGGNLAEIL